MKSANPSAGKFILHRAQFWPERPWHYMLVWAKKGEGVEYVI